MFDSPNHTSNFHEKKGGHTLPLLEKPPQTKATKTPALSFIFVFSAFIERLGRIMEEGPYLHCPDLQRQSSKNNILGWVPGEGCWGFVVGKSWQHWLWSVKIFLHPLHIYWLVFTPCPLRRIIYSNTMLSGASDFLKVHSSLKQSLASKKWEKKKTTKQLCLDCLPRLSLTFVFERTVALMCVLTYLS